MRTSKLNRDVTFGLGGATIINNGPEITEKASNKSELGFESLKLRPDTICVECCERPWKLAGLDLHYLHTTICTEWRSWIDVFRLDLGRRYCTAPKNRCFHPLSNSQTSQTPWPPLKTCHLLGLSQGSSVWTNTTPICTFFTSLSRSSCTWNRNVHSNKAQTSHLTAWPSRNVRSQHPSKEHMSNAAAWLKHHETSWNDWNYLKSSNCLQ